MTMAATPHLAQGDFAYQSDDAWAKIPDRLRVPGGRRCRRRWRRQPLRLQPRFSPDDCPGQERQLPALLGRGVLRRPRPRRHGQSRRLRLRRREHPPRHRQVHARGQAGLDPRHSGHACAEVEQHAVQPADPHGDLRPQRRHLRRRRLRQQLHPPLLGRRQAAQDLGRPRYRARFLPVPSQPLPRRG